MIRRLLSWLRLLPGPVPVEDSSDWHFTGECEWFVVKQAGGYLLEECYAKYVDMDSGDVAWRRFARGGQYRIVRDEPEEIPCSD